MPMMTQNSESNNLYEIAAEQRWRFSVPVPARSFMVEELEHHSVNETVIDTIYIGLQKELAELQTTGTGLLHTDANKQAKIDTLQKKMSLLEHILRKKQARVEAAKNRVTASAELQSLLAIKEARAAEAKKNMSDADLDAAIARAAAAAAAQ